MWGVLNIACNVVSYSVVTVINTVGNLTSPFYNWDTERKFDLNSNITDTGLTMDDFDSEYSNISQELSKIKKNLIGQLGNDQVSKFTSEVLLNKIDTWMSSCHGQDYSAIRKDFNKIKITFQQQFDIYDDVNKVDIEMLNKPFLELVKIRR